MTQTKRQNHSKQEIGALLLKIHIPWSNKSKDKGKSSFFFNSKEKQRHDTDKKRRNTFLADQMLRTRARQPAARRRGISQLEREEAIFVFCLKIEKIYLIAWI